MICEFQIIREGEHTRKLWSAMSHFISAIRVENIAKDQSILIALKHLMI